MLRRPVTPGRKPIDIQNNRATITPSLLRGRKDSCHCNLLQFAHTSTEAVSQKHNPSQTDTYIVTERIKAPVRRVFLYKEATNVTQQCYRVRTTLSNAGRFPSFRSALRCHYFLRPNIRF